MLAEVRTSAPSKSGLLTGHLQEMALALTAESCAY